MSWEAWYTLVVLLCVAIALMREWFPPSAVMLGGLVLVLVPGIVTPAQALSGFSNPAPFTIAALYVFAGAVGRTGVLAPLANKVFDGSDSPVKSIWRMTVPTTAASSILNNTPIVAMLIPQVEAWARSRDRSVSHYLMPLSFAAILGGVVTIMGTATNVAVSGLLEEIGQEPLGVGQSKGVPQARQLKVGLQRCRVGAVIVARSDDQVAVCWHNNTGEHPRC